MGYIPLTLTLNQVDLLQHITIMNKYSLLNVLYGSIEI